MTETKVIIALEARNRSGFIALSTGGAKFSKEVLRVGKWIHPVTGQVLDFTRERLAKLAKATNRWIELGHKVWFPNGHTKDAEANLGFWSNFRMDGDSLLADVDPTKDGVAAKLGKDIQDVSAAFGPEIASNGDAFDEVIVHVAATPCPVIPGQENFVKLARLDSGDDYESAMTQLAGDEFKNSDGTFKGGFDGCVAWAKDTKGLSDDRARALCAYIGRKAGKIASREKPENKGQVGAQTKLDQGAEAVLDQGAEAVLDEIKKALGLAPETDSQAVLQAIREKCGYGGATTEIPAAAPIAMSREIETLKTQLSRQAGEIQALRVKSAKREIELAREQSAAAGIPIPADRLTHAEKLLSDPSTEDTGRMLLSVMLERAKERELVLTKGAIVLENPNNKNAELERKKAQVAATASGLRAAGYTVELSADGAEITKKIAPAREPAKR